MKIAEIREKSNSELSEALLELCRDQFNLRMQKATGQLSKSDQIKKNRRSIARINTVLNEKSKQA
jgi:large subunit ribosomal protein L29